MTHIPLWLKIQNLPETAFKGKSRIIFEFIKDGVTEENANSVGMSWVNAIAIEPHWTMANIAKEMGLFPSVSQAKKNNWDFPIEIGFSERGGIGKKNLCFFIWNPPDELSTPPSEAVRLVL